MPPWIDLRFEPRRINLLVNHHSLTADGKTVSWSAIRRYHMDVRGWKDIGYHLGVELVGDRYEVLWGRPWRQIGAHAIGANQHSLGICWIGDFSVVAPSEQMIHAGVRMLADLCSYLDLRPQVAIVGHKDVSENRTCPGAAFPLERIKAMVANRPT